MRYNVTTLTNHEFPWKLTVGTFVASFSTLDGAEAEGRKRKGEFTIEHIVEARDYFPVKER